MKMTVSMATGAPRANRSIGAILMDSGSLTPEDADRVLLLQKEQGLRFGEKVAEMSLGYQDSESELITITSQEDWEVCIEEFKEKSKGEVYKPYVPDGPPPVPKN